MSSDGNLKLSPIPYGARTADARKQRQQDERTCAFCEHPISRSQTPVLLKSGKSLHLDCYLRMPKRPRTRGSRSK